MKGVGRTKTFSDMQGLKNYLACTLSLKTTGGYVSMFQRNRMKLRKKNTLGSKERESNAGE